MNDILAVFVWRLVATEIICRMADLLVRRELASSVERTECNGHCL